MAPIHPRRTSGSVPAARPTPLGSRSGKERMSVRLAVRWAAAGMPGSIGTRVRWSGMPWPCRRCRAPMAAMSARLATRV